MVAIGRKFKLSIQTHAQICNWKLHFGWAGTRLASNSLKINYSMPFLWVCFIVFFTRSSEKKFKRSSICLKSSKPWKRRRGNLRAKNTNDIVSILSWIWNKKFNSICAKWATYENKCKKYDFQKDIYLLCRMSDTKCLIANENTLFDKNCRWFPFFMNIIRKIFNGCQFHQLRFIIKKSKNTILAVTNQIWWNLQF